MSMNDALWVQGVGTNPLAHLLRPNGGATKERRAWCDAATDNNIPAPYLTRCKSCVNEVSKYAGEAITPVPTRVLTTLVIEIEHGSDDVPDQVCATAARRIAPGRSPRWKVLANVQASRALDPSETS